MLAAFENDAASFAVLKNPRCTAKIIHAILLRDEDDELSALAAVHGKCSPETRSMVLDRNRDDRASMAMVRSSYCPKELKKKWMEATGRIEKPKTEEEILAERRKKELEESLGDMRPTGM